MRHAAVLCLLLSLPAAAQGAQNAVAEAPPQAAPDQAPPSDEAEPRIVVEAEKPKPVCETRRETGSIIPKRVCRTPEQVAAETERAGIVMDRLQRDEDTANHVRASRGNR